MKCRNFNKLGGTEFRTKSQVEGYIQVANFLLTMEIEKIDLDELDNKFKKYIEDEQIYSYKNDKIIKNRFNMVIKIFKQLGLIKKEENKILILKKELEELIENPNKIFFSLIYKNFDFFKLGIDYLLEVSKLDAFIFSTALLIFEPEKDDFKDVYNHLESDFESTMKSLVVQIYNTSNFVDLTGHDFIKQYRKKPRETDLIISIFEKIKNKDRIEDILINTIKDIPVFKFLLSLKENGFYKKKNKKNKSMKNNFLILKNYLSNVEYNDFFMEINVAKLYSNLGNDYNDLMMRWLNDFNLIYYDNVVDDNFDFNQIEKKIELKDIELNFKNYPYSLENVKDKLNSIQEKDFNFKFQDNNIKDTPNSAIAEYFVNLYFAIVNNIDPNKFHKYSRTKLKSKSLYPYSHAPGKGPDMYLLENENRKLKIIETTIHNTIKQIKNNEIFNVIDHVKLNEIDYINKNLKDKIKSTEIILVTPLNSFSELKEVEKTLKLNFDNTEYCGDEKNLKVTNFKEVTNFR